MSRKERASLGFGDEWDSFDPAAWSEPKPAAAPAKPEPAEVRRAAEAAGFRSREPAKAAPPPEPAPKPQQRRRRTGRNVQFNIKTRQDAIDAFARIADARGWGFGEAFERATELLEREHAAGRHADASAKGSQAG